MTAHEYIVFPVRIFIRHGERLELSPKGFNSYSGTSIQTCHRAVGLRSSNQYILRKGMANIF